MASFVFDYAKGRIVELADCPRTRDGLGTDNLLWVLLTTTGLQSDANLNNNATLAAIFSAGNTEATFTNYARKVLVRGDVTIAVNTSTGVTTLDAADPQWNAAGGAANNTTAKLLLVYRPSSVSADSACTPLCSIDASGSTTGGNFPVALNASGIATAG